MSFQRDDEIAEEAAAWVARHDRVLSADEAVAYRAWVAADPRHGAEVERVRRAWGLANQAGLSPQLRAMAAVADRPRRRRIAAVLYFSAAGAAAAALVMALALRPGPRPGGSPLAGQYRVLPADERRVSLPDGSIVEARGNSRFTPRYTAETRQVELAAGEALFSVAHNTARPFVVAVDQVRVRAVGTAFDVRKSPGRIEVVVTKGRVLVEQTVPAGRAAVPLLSAGDRAILTLDAGGAVEHAAVDHPRQTALDRELAWRSAWIAFDRTPLDQAAQAFTALGTARLALGDPALAKLRLGGTFRADNVDGFVRLLHETLDVRAERHADGTIVLLPDR